MKLGYEIAGIALLGLVIVAVALRCVTALVGSGKLPRLALRPTRFLIVWVGALLVFSLILSRFGYDNFMNALTAVLATLAIGFVAVWSVLSNFLCTFLLILMKPFSVHDQVDFPEAAGTVKGKVVDLNLISTTLVNEQGEYFHVPNSMFYQRVVKITRGDQKITLEEQFQLDEEAK